MPYIIRVKDSRDMLLSQHYSIEDPGPCTVHIETVEPPPTPKALVVACTLSDFVEYCHSNDIHVQRAVHVSHPDLLRGGRGKVHFADGWWHGRSDADIREMLVNAELCDR